MGTDVVKLTAIGIGMLVLVVGTSLWGFTGLQSSVDDTHRASQVIRNQMDADMMHDALRADVFASLLAMTPADHAAAASDLQEHATKFRSALEANRTLALSPALTAAVADAGPRLESYIRAAESLVAAAAVDRVRASRELPKFQEEFGVLEKVMSDLSDQIEDLATGYQQTATRAQTMLRWLLLGIGVVSAGVLAMIGASLRRSVRAKERAELEAQDKLAGLTRRDLEQAQQLREQVQVLLLAVEDAAKGDLTREVTVVDDGVVGQMAVGLRAFLDDLRHRMSAISAHATTLGRASEELSGVSGRMSGSASAAASQAQACTAASEVVSESVQTVAAGTTEMTAAIQEISRSASEATRVAAEAVSVAGDANQIVHKLGASSSEVGNVVKLITQIASQTKLLALNATIEAARAGDSGRGFAVVANEVSELAKKTAAATDDIGHRIESIQEDTRAAVANIERVAEIIDRINGLQLSIAGAIEEQTATTNEMSRNVMAGARGANEISHSIAGVAQAAGETSTSAKQSAAASRELATMADDLRTLVERYRLAPAAAEEPYRDVA